MNQRSDPPAEGDTLRTSGYISPRCSTGDHGRCPDGPDPAYKAGGPHACGCRCGHRARPSLPAEA